MIQDLINSTKVTLYERTASPLFGAFLISWCLWNWEIILVVLSNIPVMNKLSFMRSHLSSFLSASCVLFIGPTITSLAYLFLYPIPAKYVYGYSQRQQRALKSIRISVEDETPLSLEESRRLRGKLTELEDSYYAQLSSKDAEIDKLRVQLQALTVESEPDSLSAPKPDATHIKHSNTSPKQSTVSNALMLDENKEQGITTPIIINFSVADQTYNLGVDYHNSEPGQVNVVKLKDSFSFRDKLLVKFTLDKPLQEGQFISVFDGHTGRVVDSDSFEIEKIDYENKNAFIVVEQNNPLRDNTKMVVSNKVQFAY